MEATSTEGHQTCRKTECRTPERAVVRIPTVLKSIRIIGECGLGAIMASITGIHGTLPWPNPTAYNRWHRGGDSWCGLQPGRYWIQSHGVTSESEEENETRIQEDLAHTKHLP